MQRFTTNNFLAAISCFMLLVCLAAPAQKHPAAAVTHASSRFNGNLAYEYADKFVACGPRWIGSPGHVCAENFIKQHFSAENAKGNLEEDTFTASTPAGAMTMHNFIAKFPGKKDGIIVIASHYDTLYNRKDFVGANDGGSSAAFLLEMARLLGRRENPYTIWLVFFDGEEALRSWSATDSLYGSRHLVNKLTADGDLSRIQAMILVDMVADASLDIRRDINSTPWLSDLLFQTADRLGYSRTFLKNQITAIEDDHVPFVNAGVPAVDVIDLDYGPDNSYHHTAQDTLDKCSPQSLQIVGRVVTAMLDALEHSPRLH